MLHFGIVTNIDPDLGRAKVTFEDLDGMQSDWLPVLQVGARVNKGYWLPDVNEQVACLMQDKRAENGVILGACYNSADTPDADAKGLGVRALKLIENGLPVFLATVKRALSGAFSLWTKGAAKVETGADLELAAGLRLKLSSTGPLKLEAGGEDLHALLKDIGKFLATHKHVVAGPATTVLQPTDLASAVDIQARIELFTQA